MQLIVIELSGIMKDSLRDGKRMHLLAIDGEKQRKFTKKMETEKIRKNKFEERRNKKIAQQQIVVNSMKPQILANAKYMLKGCKPNVEEQVDSN